MILVVKKVPRHHRVKGGDISIKKFYSNIIFKSDLLPDEVQEIMESRVENDIIKVFGKHNEDSADFDKNFLRFQQIMVYLKFYNPVRKSVIGEINSDGSNSRRGTRIDYSENPYPESQLLNEAQDNGDVGDEDDNCDNSVEDGVGGGMALRLDTVLSSGGNFISAIFFFSSQDIAYKIVETSTGMRNDSVANSGGYIHGY